MTLIGVISPNDFPVMFGDLLISGPTPPSEMDLPIGGQIRKFESDTQYWYASSLRQKLALISPNLAVAWSGSAIAARAVITDIRDAFGDRRLSATDFFNVLDRLDYPEKNDVSLIGLSIDSDERLHRFSHQATPQFLGASGNAYLAGSGVEDFAQHLARFDLSRTRVSGEMNIMETAVGHVLAYASQIVFNEVLNQSNLGSYYGGGYEFISLVKDGDGSSARLQKVPTITYMFWERTDASSGECRLIPIIISFQYRGDLLVITRLVAEDVRDYRGHLLFKKEIKVHFVSPVYGYHKPVGLLEEPILPPRTPLFLVAFIAAREAESMRVGMLIKKSTLAVRFEDPSSLKVDVEFDGEYLDEVKGVAAGLQV